jgi:zinc-ribbon domain
MPLAMCPFEVGFFIVMAVVLFALAGRLLHSRRPSPPQCSECGFPLRDGATECAACGHQLHPPSELLTTGA